MLTGPNTNIAKGSGIVLLGGDTVLVLDTSSSKLWSIDASATLASAGSSFSNLTVTSAATYGPLSSSLGLLLNSGSLYLLSTTGSSVFPVASGATITSFVAAPDGSHFAYLQTSTPKGLYGTTGSSSGGVFPFCLPFFISWHLHETKHSWNNCELHP